MIFRRKHSVPKMCCPHSIQATHTILMPVCHSEVSNRFFGLWSPRRFCVACFDVDPMLPCVKINAFAPYQKLEVPDGQHAPPAQYRCIIMLAKDRVVVSKMWTTGY